MGPTSPRPRHASAHVTPGRECGAWLQVWSPRDTYVNHHEVTNLLVDLPEDGPMRDSIFAIMKVRLHFRYPLSVLAQSCDVPGALTSTLVSPWFW